jgi:hypothetical protein
MISGSNLVDKDTTYLSPKINVEPEIRSRTSSTEWQSPNDLNGFLFNLKITDLSRLDNPYVIFENKRID